MVDAVLQQKFEKENVVVTNARHYHALAEVDKSLNDIKDGLEHKIAGYLLAQDLRRCLHYLG
jgi:tRNA modification GTPase